MDAKVQEQVAFFLTGRRSGEGLGDVEPRGLKPAFFARYRDLTRLRYDFPVVLVAGRTAPPFVQSLSAVIESALANAAPGSNADRVRQHAWRIEQEVRAMVVGGATGTLSSLCATAVSRLARDADSAFAESARRVSDAFTVEGEIVDCDATLPSRLVQHIWNAVQGHKAQAFRRQLERLVLRLSDILRADYAHSGAARSAEQLKAAVGSGFGGAFDFDRMSQLLSTALPSHGIPARRHERLVQVIDLLRRQRFFVAPAADGADEAVVPYGFIFGSCAEALVAFRERTAALTEVAKAIAIAELEIDGQYNETRHDPLFEHFGANGLDPQELDAFPDYLVCINAATLSPVEQSMLLEILSSGLPIKVLLQIDDILEESPNTEGSLTTGIRSRQIASMAMGLNEAYVLQSSASNLYRLRESIARGLGGRGPALFSVYSGANGVLSGVTPYLMSAAAMESRAFPAFTYDPWAGPDWASRFSLEANPQVELDWPVHHFAYEDGQHQRVSEDVAFTFVDFVAADRRYARHLAHLSREQWSGSQVQVDTLLARDSRGLPDRVPAVFMVDGDDLLQKVLVDGRLIREARRCREMWHSLQELGGVHNSHAEQLLARERRTWEAQVRQEADAHAVDALVASVSAAAVSGGSDNTPAAVSVATAAVAEPQRSPDEAYIETARCSTCNECTQLNSRMFAYDGNQQAYIKDVTAGTYAQLVEAAESCQVAIIHPGKPRDPNEPGLDRLLERAAPFR